MLDVIPGAVAVESLPDSTLQAISLKISEVHLFILRALLILMVVQSIADDSTDSCRTSASPLFIGPPPRMVHQF